MRFPVEASAKISPRGISRATTTGSTAPPVLTIAVTTARAAAVSQAPILKKTTVRVFQFTFEKSIDCRTINGTTATGAPFFTKWLKSFLNRQSSIV
jgi:hypothetical protein